MRAGFGQAMSRRRSEHHGRFADEPALQIPMAHRADGGAPRRSVRRAGARFGSRTSARGRKDSPQDRCGGIGAVAPASRALAAGAMTPMRSVPMIPCSACFTRCSACEAAWRTDRLSSTNILPACVRRTTRLERSKSCTPNSVSKRLDLHAQRRLGDVQTARRPGEAEFFSHGHEIPEMTQFHTIDIVKRIE